MVMRCQLNPDRQHYFIPTREASRITHTIYRLYGWKTVGVPGEGERVLDWHGEVEVEGHCLALPWDDWTWEISIRSSSDRHRDVPRNSSFDGLMSLA